MLDTDELIEFAKEDDINLTEEEAKRFIEEYGHRIMDYMDKEEDDITYEFISKFMEKLSEEKDEELAEITRTET